MSGLDGLGWPTEPIEDEIMSESDTPRTNVGVFTVKDTRMEIMRDDRQLVDAFLCRTIEKELTAARAELSEMTAKAMSLVAHLPPDTLCGDIQKWRDEYKAVTEQRDRLAEALKNCLGWTHRAVELEVSYSMREAQEIDIKSATEALQSLTTNKEISHP